MKTILLRDHPELLDKAALWFSEKWSIPFEAYHESIKACQSYQSTIPQWYLVIENATIIAGCGVIDNDFHNRKDLTPNLCALFVQENYRRQGIARSLLNFVRRDLNTFGLQDLYLVTDHIDFYEKCGWSFLTTVLDDEGQLERLYTAPTLTD